MSVEKVTAAQFVQRIKAAITSRNKSYDVNVGPIPDVITNPMGGVLETQNAAIVSLQSLISLINDGSYTYDDLVAFVKNEGITPDTGAAASATLTFSVANVTSTLTVNAGYPVGSLSDEETGTAITFITAETATLLYSARASYFNPDTQRYELQVAAVATSGGVKGNVGANRIINPLRPLVGFDSITNVQAATGGRDSSSDSELIEQYLIAITGSNASSEDGTRRISLDLFSNVQDVAMVYGSDALLTRASTDAGAVDQWVLGSALVSRTDASTYVGALQPIYMLNQPVVQVTRVLSGANNLVEGTDFSFVKDTSGYSGSVRGQDYIMLLNTSILLPASGSPITVIYNQNALIEQIQNTFITPQYYAYGSDLLIRAADQINITITATFKTRQGYSPTTVQGLIEIAIYDFVNALMLAARIPSVSDGGSVQKSDIDAEVRRISGVDNFTITVFDIVGGTGNADIPIGRNQYPRIDTANMTVTAV
jgi:hypothetical protein